MQDDILDFIAWWCEGHPYTTGPSIHDVREAIAEHARDVDYAVMELVRSRAVRINNRGEIIRLP